MNIDQTTLKDLSIFSYNDDSSIYSLLDFTITNDGKRWLKFLLNNPHNDIQKINDAQLTIQQIIQVHDKWPRIITNGTSMVMERFYNSVIDAIPYNPGIVGAALYKFLKRGDYSLVNYSVTHAIDLLKGMQQFVELLGSNTSLSNTLKSTIMQVDVILQKKIVKSMISYHNKKRSIATTLDFGNYLLFEFKTSIFELIEHYGKLDAYYSLATASITHQFNFPDFADSQVPFIEGEGLYHLLLPKPIPYNVSMNKDSNFIFLTGANMAGKSTFIKSIGIAVYLAHLGMSVPAKSFHLSVFNGVLSNIQVADNIVKGESYFYNEVQRIKKTIVKVNNGEKWLVLIDELFKGTNVQDAMRCSTEVIKGLLKIKNSLFIVSTHLYEISDEFKDNDNIAFRYFETQVTEDKLIFNYQLREGVSNDRLGYLILKREGVIDLISNL
ncbi:MutS-related protein [Polluticaenibacter yanchengensis]|uniref:DNA mismatch repair protein MutS n=1 Tax=Polluticaenibacter yanchengensis TaxID=3014562 RepID=A0ABT4UI57_9BACT|nr:DNA mismatch repair protein MutS [Chitinophagaceae bacterium LY-5]